MKANGVSFVNDVVWTTHLRVDADKGSAPPFGGIESGVNAVS